MPFQMISGALLICALGVAAGPSAMGMSTARKVGTGLAQENTTIPNDKQEMMQRDSSVLHNLQEHGSPTYQAPQSDQSSTDSSARSDDN